MTGDGCDGVVPSEGEEGIEYVQASSRQARSRNGKWRDKKPNAGAPSQGLGLVGAVVGAARGALVGGNVGRLGGGQPEGPDCPDCPDRLRSKYPW